MEEGEGDAAKFAAIFWRLRRREHQPAAPGPCIMCGHHPREKMRQVSAKIKVLEYYPSIKCGRTQGENEAGLSYNRSFHDVIHILGVARTREKMRQVSAKIILLQYFPNAKGGRN